MKSVLVLALIFLVSGPALSGELDNLSFLKGCWGAMDGRGSKVTEDWFKNSNNVMVGVSQTIRVDGETLSHEFLTIRSNPSQQQITYTPILNGQPLAPFSYDKENSGSTVAIFQNSQPGDFPETIRYSRGSGSALRVSLEGLESGSPTVVRYELDKEDCTTRF